MKISSCSGVVMLSLALPLAGQATAGGAGTAAAPSQAGAKAAEATERPPLPADAHPTQSITLDGKKLAYTVTVGTLPVRDAAGKETGKLVYTAYTVDGA